MGASAAAADGKGGFVEATYLVAKETEPPDGNKPVEWRLLTNLVLTRASGSGDLCITKWAVSCQDQDPKITKNDGKISQAIIFNHHACI